MVKKKKTDFLIVVNTINYQAVSRDFSGLLTLRKWLHEISKMHCSRDHFHPYPLLEIQRSQAGAFISIFYSVPCTVRVCACYQRWREQPSQMQTLQSTIVTCLHDASGQLSRKCCERNQPLSDWSYDPLQRVEHMLDTAQVAKNLPLNRPGTWKIR